MELECGMSESVLKVKDFTVEFWVDGVWYPAAVDMNFELNAGRVLAIVGESGSGKSTTALGIVNLLSSNARMSGSVKVKGQEMIGARPQVLRKFRGKEVAYIFQEPMTALNPVMRVGDQIAEAYLVHHQATRAQAREKTLAMLEAVKIRNPARVYDLYPHEVSGGMGQRVMIAMMLIPEPEFLIADEPTSALDVTVRMQVLAILDDLVQSRGLGLMFISHDLNLVATFCDRVLIMYAGRIVESCRAADLRQARHGYTRGLLESLPRIGERRDRLSVLERDPAWRDAPAIHHE